jgi:uncharacterized protein
MDRYQLAKIVGWAGTLDARKRIQKVVYFLKAAGCPLEADYTLHHYGPYSQDVARLTDEMVRMKLLEESSQTTRYGLQYSYSLPDATKRKLDEYEQGPQSQKSLACMSPYEQSAKELIKADLKELEIAATLVYFRRQDNDWSVAAEKTRQFKNLDSVASSDLLRRAEELAKRIVA